jgi:hypothetical protein
MKANLSVKITLATLTMLALIAVTPIANASTIIYDSFSRIGVLNGSSPDITQNVGDQWVSLASPNDSLTATDGSILNIGNAGNIYKASLAFAPTNGSIYTLSADVNVTAGGTDWVGLGFATDNNTAYFSGVNGWMLLSHSPNNNDGYSQAFLAGTNNIFANNSGYTSGSHNLSLTLNTISSQWSLSVSVDGNMIGTTSYATNPAISNIFIQKSPNALASFDNLIVTQIPEPSSSGMLFLGLFVLGFMSIKVSRKQAS